jgi:hypothetical protein
LIGGNQSALDLRGIVNDHDELNSLVNQYAVLNSMFRVVNPKEYFFPSF